MFDIVLKPFDTNWSAYFQEDAHKIMSLFEDDIVSIIHIGSNMVTNSLIRNYMWFNSIE